MEKSVLLLSFKKISLLIVFLFLSSCSKDDDVVSQTSTPDYKCFTCKTKPEALAINDNSNNGIYLGVTYLDMVYFNINNLHDEKYTAKVVRDGIVYDFKFFSTWSEKFSHYYVFRGQIDSEASQKKMVSVFLKVDEDGTDPRLFYGLDELDKHPTEINVVKEKSDELIEIFNANLYKRKSAINEDLEEENQQVQENSEKFIGPITDLSKELIGNEKFIISRSKLYWHSISYGFGNYNFMNHFNFGGIRDQKLIDRNNKFNGSLKGDLIYGSKADDYLDRIFIDAKRVF